jgi:nitric-oxide synthase
MSPTKVLQINNEAILAEAQVYLDLFSQENGGSSALSSRRLAMIQSEIERSGTYWQTPEELTYGAMVAWRNNTHCIGRLHWKTLQVRDKRHLTTASQIFEAVVEHLHLATNRGKIRPMITIFAQQEGEQPGIRIWNPQLIRYAGYQQADGSWVGDPLHAELTEVLRHLGWKGGAGTPFDILPLVIQMPGKRPEMFELPSEAVLEVPLIHPDFAWFAELGLKWHALPAISDMRLEIGGISYTAAPFSGWYMCTEIGARNLGDVNRYNLLPVIAKHMGLSTDSDRSLWKDYALVELNKAVLYSFSRQGVAMVDHHTVSRQFVLHEEKEQEAGRRTPAEWMWMVPPISSSATAVYQRRYKNVTLKPNIFSQPVPWRGEQTASPNPSCPFASAVHLSSKSLLPA